MGALTKSLQNISVRTKLLTGFGLVSRLRWPVPT